MKVNHSIRVNAPVERAFEAFVDEIGKWWPSEGFSFLPDRPSEVVMEGRVGGRLFEKASDGEEFSIGEVTGYDPPNRVVFTWGNPRWENATECEVAFLAEGEGTRVDLEHRGFDRIGPESEGAYNSYKGGWVEVLRHYEKYI